MDLAALNRTPVAVASAVARVESLVVREAVRTELPEVAVLAPASVDRARLDRREAGINSDAPPTSARRPQTENAAVVRVREDAAAREIVFQRVDPRTGQVVSQFPDEDTLRRRSAIQQILAAADERFPAVTRDV